MTFVEWWEIKPRLSKPTNKAAAAERQRCREIALNVGQNGISDQWFDCADNIACRIGE